MESDKKLEVMESSLARHLSWIAAADGKTGIVFAIDTAMMGTLAALAPHDPDWTMLFAAPALVAALLLAASVFMLSLASFPRTTGPKGSLIFFGQVGGLKLEDFIKRIRARSPDDYLTDLATQCHRNAQIACQKYAWVKRALIALYLSLAPWLVAIFLLHKRK